VQERSRWKNTQLCSILNSFARRRFDKVRNMKSTISDLALDLGVFALDNETENGETRETTFAAPPHAIRENNVACPTQSPVMQTLTK